MREDAPLYLTLHQVGTLTEHEKATLQAVAHRLALLKNLVFLADTPVDPVAAAYVVPTGTLCDPAEARRLGISAENDFFGGLVSRPFAETKAITHGLVAPDAEAPADWLPAFPAAVKNVVVDGFTAYSRSDATVAADLLLQSGPVRVKPVLARGGMGQIVVSTRTELDAALDVVAEPEIQGYGLVLEENLQRVATYSVGQVRVDGLIMSYCGTQETTTNNKGALVYGGTTLIAARRGYDALASLRLPASILKAVELARVYDEAADRHIPGFIASRRNYDVAHGRNRDGSERFGVLEQSWRIGGASTAEVLALLTLADPDLTVVRAASVERYGTGRRVPKGATIFFRGDDPTTGPLLKYAKAQTR